MKMKTEPQEDCAVSVKVTHSGNNAKFHFKRLASLGKHSKSIDFKEENGRIDIRFEKWQKSHQFTISFLLPDDDGSGGFAGMKIWKVQGGPEPKGFFLPPCGKRWRINEAFDLEARCFDPEKVTVL